MKKNITNLRAMSEAKVGDKNSDKLHPGIVKTTSFELDPRLIQIEPGFNARPLDDEQIESFRKSIRAGSHIPRMEIKIINGAPTVRDGHHRLAAYMAEIEAGNDIRTVPCDEFKGNDEQALVLLITSASGHPLTPLQLGLVYARLDKKGWNKQQIADAVGKSSQHVGDMLILARGDSDVHEMVKGGTVAAHVAMKAVREHGTEAGKILKSHLNKARASGKSKVTNKTVAPAYIAPVVSEPDTVAKFIYKMMNDKEHEGFYYAAIACHNYRIGNFDTAQPDIDPITMTLADAIRMEIDTGVKCEMLCPEHQELIQYLRASS